VLLLQWQVIFLKEKQRMAHISVDMHTFKEAVTQPQGLSQTGRVMSASVHGNHVIPASSGPTGLEWPIT